MQEDDADERYFFDAGTQDSLLGLLARYAKPLLGCAPSLAVASESAGQLHSQLHYI